jgi:hypothetical protein
VVDVTAGVVGLHSSDPVTVYLSAAQRMRAGSIEAVDDALYNVRSVFRIHAMRRTLWVFPGELVRAAQVSTTMALVRAERKRLATYLTDSGVTDKPDEWIDAGCNALIAELTERGEASTRQLGEALPQYTAAIQISPGKSYGVAASAHTRLLLLLGFTGTIIRARPIGSWVSGQYRWAPTGLWSGNRWKEEQVPTGAEAQATMIAAYLRAFGPATLVDAQWWSGWSKAVLVKAIKTVGAIEVDTDHGPAFVAPDDLDVGVGEVEPWVALLPSLDPTTMGWKQRAWYLPDELAGQVFDRNGNGGPTVWADGRIIGAWAQREDGSITTLTSPLTATHRKLLDAEIERVRALVGDTRFRERFPSPLSRTLAGQ